MWPATRQATRRAPDRGFERNAGQRPARCGGQPEPRERTGDADHAWVGRSVEELPELDPGVASELEELVAELEADAFREGGDGGPGKRDILAAADHAISGGL